jgi:hypothetical protein
MLHAVTRKTLLLTALIAFAASTAFARDDIRTERVYFKPGASSATIKGKIKGYETERKKPNPSQFPTAFSAIKFCL